MSLPSIKIHLPLTTEHIRFERIRQSSQPMVTNCIDFRHGFTQRPKPTVRFDIPPAPVVANGETKNQAIDFDDDASMSSLTDINSDFDTDDSLIPSPGERTIKKPPGQVNRPNLGGFNLQDALNWKRGDYEKFQAYVYKLANAKLDTTQCLTQQESQKLETVYRAAEHKFDKLRIYEDHWLIRELLKSHLKTKSAAAHNESNNVRSIMKNLVKLNTKRLAEKSPASPASSSKV
ncbi:hypothetical protein BDQ17DRAFT_1427415 [Cyathus striatus]|nr:hypothetical protein BDQ17DRAFT_1427415 [Cyathus striatus]